MRLLVGQCVLPDEVAVKRLVRAGREITSLGEKLDLQRQQVAEDAGERDDHVDPRPAELVERHQLCAGETAVAVEAWQGADER